MAKPLRKLDTCLLHAHPLDYLYMQERKFQEKPKVAFLHYIKLLVYGIFTQPCHWWVAALKVSRVPSQSGISMYFPSGDIWYSKRLPHSSMRH